MFAEDHARAAPYRASASDAPLGPPPAPERALAAAANASAVTLLVSPESALPGVLDVVRGASATLDVQLLRLEPRWRGESSPLMDALLAAARRGASVRVLLDGSFGDEESADAARLLAAAAREEGLPLAARLGPATRTIHNKGAVADGERALVGSVNWVRAAFEDNREVALVVESREASARWSAAFEADWAAAADVARPVPAGAGLALAAAAAVALFTRREAGAHEAGPRQRARSLPRP